MDIDRRRVVQTLIVGGISVGRLFLANDDDSSPSTLSVVEPSDSQRTLQFTVGADETSHILISATDGVRVSYLLEVTNEIGVNVYIQKYNEQNFSTPSKWLRFSDLSQNNVTRASGSHLLPSVTGNYVISINNNESGLGSELIGLGSEAKIQCSVRVESLDNIKGE